MTGTGKDNPNWKGGLVELSCRHCNELYSVIQCRKLTSKYCSRICQNRYQALSLRKENSVRAVAARKWNLRSFPRKKCVVCGFAGVKKGRKMHPDCRPSIKHPKMMRTCTSCGETRMMIIKDGIVPARCRSCEYENRKGENNNNWIDGRTPKNHIIRNSKQYSEWRKSVFVRDDYTCVFCGIKGGTLNADHIKPFSKYPDLRFDISNGRTLCVPCHKTTDTYLSKSRRKTLEAHKQEILG